MACPTNVPFAAVTAKPAALYMWEIIFDKVAYSQSLWITSVNINRQVWSQIVN